MCELRREGPPSHHLRAVGCGANALAMQGTRQQIYVHHFRTHFSGHNAKASPPATEDKCELADLRNASADD